MSDDKKKDLIKKIKTFKMDGNVEYDSKKNCNITEQYNIEDQKYCPIGKFQKCIGDECVFSRTMSYETMATEKDLAHKITRCEVIALDVWNEKILKTFQDVLGSLYTLCDSMGIDQIKRRLDAIEMYVRKNDDKFYRMINKDKIKKEIAKKVIKKSAKKVKKKLVRK